MPGSQPTKSPGARGKRTINPNPKYATQPGMAATQHDRRGSLSSVTASSPAAASPMRHGVVSPMQQAHDTATMMRDLLARLVRVEAEVGQLKAEQLNVEAEVGQLKDKKRRLEEELTQEKKEGERRDKEMEELKKRSVMAEETERSVGAKDAIEAVVYEVEKNELKNGVKEAMETMKAETSVMKRAAAKVMDRLEEERRREPRKEANDKAEMTNGDQTKAKEVTTDDRSVTAAKGVVDVGDPVWEGGVSNGDKYLILTDSNGAGVTEDTVKRHMPKEKRQKCRIRVVTTYTLFEAFDKIRDGKIKVEGARVVLDVTTNDIRGTRGQARTTPQELINRVGKVVAIMKEKGARGVAVCEVKPMNLMDVTPYSELLHHSCKGKNIGWCRTQLGVTNLRDDGYHILPASLRVLDATYAYAIMGKPVPHPTPTHQKWRHQLVEQEWPRAGERLELNVWKRREEERRRMGTEIR
jgi:hypothetical protein